MAVKKVEVPEIGVVNLYKRRGAKTMRLSITSTGEIRVSLPYWLPYASAIQFANSKRDWILSKHTAPKLLVHHGKVGKSHHLVFVPTANLAKPSSRIYETGEIRVKYPLKYTPTDDQVQKTAHLAAIRALKHQANQLLPQRLDSLAKKHGFEYKSLQIKRLKSRWGSCSSRKEIALNCYLMQLPWHLIDYVILHELVHTKIMAHGSIFWNELDKYVPNLKEIRREIKSYQPILS